MKKIILLALALFTISNITNAQSTKIDNIVKFKTINSGSILDKNNNVDGYYFFYEADKLKKGKREYAIKILDNELNVVATKKIINTKRTFLASSAYNNKEMLFVFINFKDKQYRLVGYDRQGNKVRDKKVPISKKEIYSLMKLQEVGYGDIILPIDNKGFILSTVVKNKKEGYKMQFLSSDENLKSWTIGSPIDSKKILTIKPIQTSDKYIVTLEMSKKSRMSKKINMAIYVIDATTGKTLFKKPYTKEENPRLITNSFIEGNEIILLGEYFKPKDNIFTAKSNGLFIERLNASGKLISEKKVSNKNKLFTKLQAKNKKTKKNTYTYFHDIVKTKNGDYYAIGELYKKTVSAAGVAGLALAMAGGGSSSIPVTQLTITDATIYQFDKDFNLKDLKIFKKGKSRAPSVSDFGSPQLNAHALAMYGAFDFINLQTDADSDRFYANFLDYNRFSKDKKGRLSFISVIYNNGQLSSDQITIKEQRRHIIKAFPAKLGHVMILDYNKKEKIVNLHLEKMNIE